MEFSQIISQSLIAFSRDVNSVPLITLRGGDALDMYDEPPCFDPLVDKVLDSYIETHQWGISHLDAASWRHYLPYFIEYSSRHYSENELCIDAILSSLRPPDLMPPRLASLNAEQEKIICDFLEILAFDKRSSHQELACQVLEEWWIPRALYRDQVP